MEIYLEIYLASVIIVIIIIIIIFIVITIYRNTNLLQLYDLIVVVFLWFVCRTPTRQVRFTFVY